MIERLFIRIPLTLIATAMMALSVAQPIDSVYLGVDRSAEPIGGMAALYKEFAGVIAIPKENHCDILKVFIEFIVENNGTMSNIRLARDRTKECEEFWVKPIMKISKKILWHPAKLKGIVVRQKMILPIEIKPG
jgi:hypothetical protein